MSKCKFCGAGEMGSMTDVKDFECGTYHVTSSADAGWAQDRKCEARCKKRDADELARFRAMFPVMPWDESPITPEVCERLGLLRAERGRSISLVARYLLLHSMSRKR